MYFNGCPLRDAVCNMLTFNNVKKLKVNISNIFTLHCFFYIFPVKTLLDFMYIYIYIYIYIHNTNILMEKSTNAKYTYF